MAKAKTPPPEPLLLPAGKAGLLIAMLLAGLAAIAALLTALPNKDYYRWQQGDGTILFRARWIYERIHFDPTPIDVAMIGSSRMEASVRTRELSAILSQRLGRPIHVVNFGLPQEGRDLHWTVAEEVLRARPELRLIVLSQAGEGVISHPGFRFVGTDAAIRTAPALYNPSFVENLLTLPYRHLAYFVQGLWPRAFGLSAQFDSRIYTARGFDPTRSFTSATGDVVDRDKQLDPGNAAAEQAAIDATTGYDPKLRYLPIDRRYAVERDYARRIAGLARARGVTVGFLHVPMFERPEHLADPGFYAAIGPVMDADFLGRDTQDYMDLGHLNRHGTARLLPWLADRMTPIVARAEAR